MRTIYEEWGYLVEPLNFCYELCKTSRRLCTLMESFPGINIIVASNSYKSHEEEKSVKSWLEDIKLDCEDRDRSNLDLPQNHKELSLRIVAGQDPGSSSRQHHRGDFFQRQLWLSLPKVGMCHHCHDEEVLCQKMIPHKL